MCVCVVELRGCPHLLPPNLLPRMTWTLSLERHSTSRGTVAKHLPSFNTHTHTHCDKCSGEKTTPHTYTHTLRLKNVNAVGIKRHQTSFGCCRMTTLVSIEIGVSGKQLHTHTTLGRLCTCPELQIPSRNSLKYLTYTSGRFPSSGSARTGEHRALEIGLLCRRLHCCRPSC